MWGKAVLRKAAELLRSVLLKSVILPLPISPSADPTALLNP